MMTGSPSFCKAFAGSSILRSLKFTPPIIQPNGGIIKSFTKEVTIFPKALPIITPTAISTTLPFMAKSLKS